MVHKIVVVRDWESANFANWEEHRQSLVANGIKSEELKIFNLWGKKDDFDKIGFGSGLKQNWITRQFADLNMTKLFHMGELVIIPILTIDDHIDGQYGLGELV